MKRALLILSLLILILSSCSQEQYDSVAPDKSVLLSVNIFDSSLTFFDTAKLTEVAKWDMPFSVTGAVLFPDGEKLLLYGKELTEAYVYEITTGKKLDTWKTGKGIVAIQASKDGKQFYLADEQNEQIRFFDIKGHETGTVAVGDSPISMVESNEEKLYVLHFGTDQIIEIDPSTQEVTRKLPARKAATGMVLLENRDEIWFGGHGTGSVVQNKISILSLTEEAIISEIDAPVMPVAFAVNDRYVYALSHGSNTLRKIDARSRKVVDEMTVGANPFTLAAIGNDIYIAGYDSNEIQVVDARTMERKATLSTGEGPFQLLVRGGKS